MNHKDIAYAVQTIQNKILTPIIYMCENEYKTEFICFCGAEASDEDFFETGETLTKEFDFPTEVVDILEYDVNDRIDIISNAELVFSEDPVIEQMFAMSVSEELRQERERKLSMMKRMNENGSYYLQ